MDGFEYSVQISELDWEAFFQVCEECNLLPPSLAGLDDSGMSDIDEKGNLRPRSAMHCQTHDPEQIDGPPDCDGSPVECYLSKYGLNTPEQVLSGSEEDCHMETINEFFERLKSVTSIRDHQCESKSEGFGGGCVEKDSNEQTAIPAALQRSDLYMSYESTDDDVKEIKKKYSCSDTELFIKEEDWSLEILRQGVKSRDWKCDELAGKTQQPDTEKTSCHCAVKDLPCIVKKKEQKEAKGSSLICSKSDFTSIELPTCQESVSFVTPRRRRRKKKRTNIELSDSDSAHEAPMPGKQSQSEEDTHTKRLEIKIYNHSESSKAQSSSSSDIMKAEVVGLSCFQEIPKNLRLAPSKSVMYSINDDSCTEKSQPVEDSSVFKEERSQSDKQPTDNWATQQIINLSSEMKAALKAKASVIPPASTTSDTESIIHSKQDSNLEFQPIALITTDHDAEHLSSLPHGGVPTEHKNGLQADKSISKTSHREDRSRDTHAVQFGEISPQHSEMNTVKTQIFENAHINEINPGIENEMQSKTCTAGTVEDRLPSENQVDISPLFNSKDTSDEKQDNTMPPVAENLNKKYVKFPSNIYKKYSFNETKYVKDVVSIAERNVELLLCGTNEIENPAEAVNIQTKGHLKEAQIVHKKYIKAKYTDTKEREILFPETVDTDAKDVQMSSGTTVTGASSSGTYNTPCKHESIMSADGDDIESKEIQMSSSAAENKIKSQAKLPYSNMNVSVTGKHSNHLQKCCSLSMDIHKSINNKDTERPCAMPELPGDAETQSRCQYTEANDVNTMDTNIPSSQAKYVVTEVIDAMGGEMSPVINVKECILSPGAENVNTKVVHILSSSADKMSSESVPIISTGANDIDDKDMQLTFSATEEKIKRNANLPHCEILNILMTGTSTEHLQTSGMSKDILECMKENEDVGATNGDTKDQYIEILSSETLLHEQSQGKRKETLNLRSNDKPKETKILNQFSKQIDAPEIRHMHQTDDYNMHIECESLIELSDLKTQSQEDSNSDANASIRSRPSSLSEDHELVSIATVNALPTTSSSDTKDEPQILEMIDSDSKSQFTTPVFAISSFWNEMEKLTINDILQLRQVGQAQHPSVLLQPENSSIADVPDTADSGYFTQFDEYKPDRSSGDMSFISDFDEDLVQLINPDGAKIDEESTWECDPNISGTGTGMEDVFIIDPDTATPLSSHVNSSHPRLRKLCKNVSIQNLQSLETQPLKKILRNASWHSLHSVYSTHLEGTDDNVDPFDRVETSSPVYLSDEEDDLDSAGITFSEILEYLFGSDEPKPKHSVSAAETVGSSYMLGAESSLPEMYDHFFSDFEAENFFYPLAQDSNSNKDETIPIFSCSRSSTKNLPFPEAYDYFFNDDSSGHSDEDEEPEHTVIRVITRHDHMSTKNQDALTTIDTDKQLFTEKGYIWTFMSKNPFSFRKIRRTGLSSPSAMSNSWALTQVNRSGRTFQRRIDVSPFPDPLMLTLENHIFKQLAVQQKLCQEIQNVFADPRVDAPLVSIKQADMCLVCIAFASWVLKSVNPQAADNWKAVLLANISALSAIRYLRRFTRDEAAKITPLRQIEPA